MDRGQRKALLELLVGKAAVETQDCVKLSAIKYIPSVVWAEMRPYQRNFLRAYALGAAAHKAVLVGRSAALMCGMWVLPSHELTVELAMPNGAPPPRRQWPDGVEYRYLTIPEPQIAEGGADKVRFTRPQRTAVDVARLHGVREGVVAMDSLFHGETPMNQQAIRRQLAQLIERMAGKKGIALAREAFALSTEKSESAYESLLRVVLHEHGISAESQKWIGPYRVDFLWGTLVIEIDGDMKYAKSPERAAIEQLERENWLREEGYEVIRIRPAALLQDEAQCVARILALKERADRNGPVRVPATDHRVASW